MVGNSTVPDDEVDARRDEFTEYRNSNGTSSSDKEESISNFNSHNHCDDTEVKEGSNNSEPTDDITNIDRVRSLTFETVKEAEEFYISYDREVGFDVRKSSLKRKKNSVLVLSRVWVCAREGFCSERIKVYDRKREAKAETRSGCKASFRVAIDNSTGEYKVTRFEPQHNHPLETSDTSHRLRCNRYLTPSTKSMLNVMTNVGFRPSHVLDFVEELGGGSASGVFGVFNRKDGHSYLNSQRLKRIESGDVNTVLGLLEGMKLKEESLRFKYIVDGNGALTRLFWCDGMSRAEYEQLGDVVLFDSTHKTDTYRFPIVLFSGVNCHLCTSIFGIAILYSETTESYRWLLQTFRESMNGKSPIAILTDQDDRIVPCKPVQLACNRPIL